ncbi:2-oxoglutarate dehydrogenase E1 component [Singulisphaera sp. GP187]|uniref:2-oxoglutarate dehydrogenase E1 component n=1 Tax=Singulisphaera sp. GP187 TaxID=1882752 RepID=UPI000928D2FD|nr:2-oxoglutarate dehydrogenase E1 component [Singulisphaera sp. GP187]SIO13643.1 2-oxoglutarate dehydrogenase E1 component [Singulisphaera sp. GP187]
MNRSTVANRWNLDLIEGNYQRWRTDPASVDESWRLFFEGYELGQSGDGMARADVDLDAARAQAAVTRLIDAYREIGHYLADLDPLKLNPARDSHELLDLAAFGLSSADLDKPFYNKLSDPPHSTLRELIAVLRETYCRKIGVEYMHIRNVEVRRWLQSRMEPNRNRPNFDLRKKRRIVLKLNAAELFESFLHSHYIGQKRFSLEGGEMLIPLLDSIIEGSSKFGVREIVMGMPHRGRLNVLANILNKPYGMIFSEFEGNMPETVGGDGDVKYHLGFSADHVTTDKHSIHLSLTPNPSHLEAVNPVVEGRVRAKQRRFKDRDRKLGLPILIHGDAAFAGQGLVPETLNLSQLPGYRTGGTIHIVVNNQIGFTTAPSEGRSTRYCTDVAKMIEVPIFHVNGEDPEAVVYVAELALEFRETFGQDVVIDMVCYRRHGHNEGDEPAFTQPLMYGKIKDRMSIRELYTENLVMIGELSTDEVETIAETFRDKMEEVYKEVHEGQSTPKPLQPGFGSHWQGFTPHYSFAPTETGIPYDTLAQMTTAMAVVPAGFAVNPKIERIYGNRVKVMEAKGGVDWAFAESLAFGSLLIENTPVRLSGQDSRRGTFSQRHAVIVDGQTGERYYPLKNLAAEQAEICIYDSLLSESAVLGFDYGYSLDEPHMLILWEAQFGDFANGAQVIIDQFIASAESKWGRASGLVMLLPHGYEGQGPEHSSARLERFLQLCAEDNIQVVTPSTPAQYFHVLRRQVRRNFRKPLIVMTPKSLLRHKLAVSPVDELVSNRFYEAIDDPAADPERIRRVVVCGGKVYYDLIAKREEVGKTRDVAIVRLEQLYPWPEEALKAALSRYKNVREWVWAQEESQNMGAWTFVAPRLQELMGFPFQYVGRDASASPATGSHSVHEREQNELVEAAIGSAIPHLVHAHPVRPAVALSLKQGVS